MCDHSDFLTTFKITYTTCPNVQFVVDRQTMLQIYGVLSVVREAQKL